MAREATETCNGRDDNCDEVIDEGCDTTAGDSGLEVVERREVDGQRGCGGGRALGFLLPLGLLGLRRQSRESSRNAAAS